MRKMFGILGALALLSSTAVMAADMPVKAPPPVNPLFTGYPYGTSGLFYGVYTEGGGGPVNGSAAGVGSASLVELSAGFGATVGYAWGSKSSPIAYSIEGDVGYTNFNGSVAGFSMGGPLSIEVRGVAFTPLANLTQYLPSFPSFGTLPPFNALPAGVTSSHTQLGIMAGWHWNDVSLDFAGLSSGKEYRGAPMVGLVQMEQLSNGMALRTYVKNIFAADAICVGPVAAKQACGGLSNQVSVGASLLF